MEVMKSLQRHDKRTVSPVAAAAGQKITNCFLHSQYVFSFMRPGQFSGCDALLHSSFIVAPLSLPNDKSNTVIDVLYLE